MNSCLGSTNEVVFLIHLFYLKKVRFIHSLVMFFNELINALTDGYFTWKLFDCVKVLILNYFICC